MSTRVWILVCKFMIHNITIYIRLAETENVDAGIISDSLMRLLERIFFWSPYNCCKSMQNDQLGGAGVELALEGNRWDG